MKPILITVSGNRAFILKHQLQYYKTFVKDAVVFINDCANSNVDLNDKSYYDAVGFGATTYRTSSGHTFDSQRLTSVINVYKVKYPKEWFLIADDDEFQSYEEDLPSIIDYSVANGYRFVSGAFVDRIGENGVLKEIKEDSDMWSLFPFAGFYRSSASQACPFKITLAAGNIELTAGQHHARVHNRTICSTEKSHALRYPIKRSFAQVHHFKWDLTVINRLKAASITEDPQYSQECLTMYNVLKANNYKIDVKNPNYYCQYSPTAKYDSYKHWPHVSAMLNN